MGRDHSQTEFHPVAVKKGIPTRATWKGDHKNCDHADGECNAFHGWQVSVRRLRAGQFPIVHSEIDRPVSGRHNAQIVFEDGADGEVKMPIAQFKDKGFIDLFDEVKGFAACPIKDRQDFILSKIRPSQAVIDAHVEAYSRERLYEMEQAKADHKIIVAEQDALAKMFATALGTSAPATAPAMTEKRGGAARV